MEYVCIAAANKYAMFAHCTECCYGVCFLPCAVLQVGAGGGMKGGVNIWKALRDNHYVHSCWMHCAGKPYT